MTSVDTALELVNAADEKLQADITAMAELLTSTTTPMERCAEDAQEAALAEAEAIVADIWGA